MGRRGRPAQKKRPDGLNREQCRGCINWKYLSGGTAAPGKACHYLLETKCRREHDGDRCLSRRTKRQADKEAKAALMIRAQGPVP